MSPENDEIERAISEIRGEEIPAPVVEAAGARVWAQISGAAQPRAVEHLRTCADFQALLADYKAGRLPESRALLVTDHLHTCVACRRVSEGKVVAFPSSPVAARRRSEVWRWAAAATVVVGTGLAAWMAAGRLGLWGSGPGVVQAVNGTLYRVAGGTLQPVGVGQEIPNGVALRTAKDSGAVVKLGDGSVVEMRERSEISATAQSRDLTIRLGQGSVIVQAVRRRTGHLYVATPDCRVSVTGTVFAVSTGVKGSRVSVVEGEVRVSQENSEKVLHPGDQTTTGTALSPLRVQDDIAWSRNAEEHLAMLRQMNALVKSLKEVRFPDLRYSSTILHRLPAGVVMYASIPNLGNYFAEAQSVFRQRLGESPQLRAWLEQRTGGHFEETISRLKTASEYFGDEVVIVALKTADAKMHGPIFLAEEKKPGFAEFLRSQGMRATVESVNGLLAFSPDPAVRPEMVAGGGFAGTALFTRVDEAYRNGAGLLFAADVANVNHPDNDAVNNIQYIVGEQKQTPQRTDVRAVVGFAGERKGIASWLAAPAPMGALQYVSPEATFVSAFVVKNPTAIVDELFGLTRGSAEQARGELARVQSETGIDVRNDVAASLGGEFAIALDGPAFPVPSWKLVVEAYDAARLQYSINKLVDAFNRVPDKQGRQPLRVAQETVNGRTYHMIAGVEPNPLTEAWYTITDGYLVAAPSRALIDRALQTRTNGVGIAKSSAFLALLPRDHYSNFSAMIYQNLGSTLAPLAGLLGSFQQVGPEGQKALGQLGNMKPALITAYGLPDRIEIVGTGEQFNLPLVPLLTGNLASVAGGAMPFGMNMGMPRRQDAKKIPWRM